MPFRSKAELAWMYKNKPALANAWKDKYGIPKNLPEHVEPKVNKNKSK